MLVFVLKEFDRTSAHSRSERSQLAAFKKRFTDELGLVGMHKSNNPVEISFGSAIAEEFCFETLCQFSAGDSDAVLMEQLLASKLPAEQNFGLDERKLNSLAKLCFLEINRWCMEAPRSRLAATRVIIYTGPEKLVTLATLGHQLHHANLNKAPMTLDVVSQIKRRQMKAMEGWKFDNNEAKIEPI